jgi:hypothetical protein
MRWIVAALVLPPLTRTTTGHDSGRWISARNVPKRSASVQNRSPERQVGQRVVRSDRHRASCRARHNWYRSRESQVVGPDTDSLRDVARTLQNLREELPRCLPEYRAQFRQALGMAIVGEWSVEMPYCPEVAAALHSARLLLQSSVMPPVGNYEIIWIELNSVGGWCHHEFQKPQEFPETQECQADHTRR